MDKETVAALYNALSAFNIAFQEVLVYAGALLKEAICGDEDSDQHDEQS